MGREEMERSDWMRRAASGVLAMLVGATIARANGPEIGFDAGTIFPIESRSVQLVSENVTIDLPAEAFSGMNEVDHNALCKYVLRNLSDSTLTFHMAFVSNARYSDDDTLDIVSNPYQVTQDGRSRDVTYYRASKENELFFSEYGSNQILFPTWVLAIGPRATSVVEIRYNASWTGGCDGETCGNDFTYYTKPAALWAGPIEQADFDLRVPDRTFLRNLRRANAPWHVEISPPGFRWTSDGLHWAFRNWEPDADLRMLVEFPAYDSGGDPAWDPWTPDSIAAMPALSPGLDLAPQVKEGMACADPRPGWGNPGDSRTAVSVRLRVHVTAGGRVDAVRYPDPPSQNPMNDVPEQCVRKWQFAPAVKAGKPVAAWTDVKVRFPATK